MIRYTQDRTIVLGLVPVRRDMFPPEPAIALKDRVVKRFEEMAESNGDIRLVTIDAVVDGGMLWDLRDVEKVVDLFRAEKVDAIVFPHCNFGQEEVVAKTAAEIGKPVLLWGREILLRRRISPARPDREISTHSAECLQPPELSSVTMFHLPT